MLRWVVVLLELINPLGWLLLDHLEWHLFDFSLRLFDGSRALVLVELLFVLLQIAQGLHELLLVLFHDEVVDLAELDVLRVLRALFVAIGRLLHVVEADLEALALSWGQHPGV